MQVTNNDKVGRYFFYKINGQTKKILVPGLATVTLPDLVSTTQVIRNTFDVKVNNINSKFGRGVKGDFTIGDIDTTPIDYHLLDTWYDSLSVKPSTGLWTDLQALANGMKTDGDWDEIDLIGMFACMETNEQRLRPFKTTSGEDFVVSGSPTLSFSGVQNPTPGNLNYVNTKWNPTDNGVKFTLGSALFGFYGDTVVSGTDGSEMGFRKNDDSGGCVVSFANTSSSLKCGFIVNGKFTNLVARNGLSSGAKRYFVAGHRTSTNSERSYANGSISNEEITTADNMSDVDIPILALNTEGVVTADTGHIVRFVIAGSGNIDPNRIANRLNTFFTARSLTISNY